MRFRMEKSVEQNPISNFSSLHLLRSFFGAQLISLTFAAVISEKGSDEKKKKKKKKKQTQLISPS